MTLFPQNVPRISTNWARNSMSNSFLFLVSRGGQFVGFILSFLSFFEQEVAESVSPHFLSGTTEFLAFFEEEHSVGRSVRCLSLSHTLLDARVFRFYEMEFVFLLLSSGESLSSPEMAAAHNGKSAAKSAPRGIWNWHQS